MDYANTVTGYAAALAAAEGDASRLWIDGQIIRVVPAPAAVNLPARVLDADDFSSVQEALDRAGALPGGACVQLPPAARKIYPVSNSAALRVPEGVYLVGTPSMSELLLITDSDDAPSTSVWWDAVLFTGSRSKWSGIVGVRIRHQGGRRNNTASIAVRAGASRVEVRDCDIDGSIGSAIVVEGNTTTPYPTYCMIRDNKISNTVRHGVYLSGSTHNRVLNNWFFTTRLESIALRNPHDNYVSGNTIVGDSTQYPPHAIAIAQPSSGLYVVKRIKVTMNQMIGIPGAGFYGQGVGATLTQCDISDNVVQAMQAPDSVSHGMMFFRTSYCRIEGNIIVGGKNRGMMFYGCTHNSIRRNKINNVNSANAAVGAMQFAEYADPKDGSTTYSTDNDIVKNVIIDDRAEPLHIYGIQLQSGNCANYVSGNMIEGAVSLKIRSVDGMDKLRMQSGQERAWYYNDISSGSLTSTQMPVIGDTYTDHVTQAGWLRCIMLISRQVVVSGSVKCTVYKNGSAWRTVELIGDGAALYKAVWDMPGQYAVEAGDQLKCFVQTTDVLTGSSVDVMCRICIVSD